MLRIPLASSLLGSQSRRDRNRLLGDKCSSGGPLTKDGTAQENGLCLATPPFLRVIKEVMDGRKPKLHFFGLQVEANQKAETTAKGFHHHRII